MSKKTRHAIPYSYSNPAEYFSLISLNNTVLVQLWVAGEGPTIEWSHLPRRIVREKRDYPSEAMEIISCTKSGRMSYL